MNEQYCNHSGNTRQTCVSECLVVGDRISELFKNELQAFRADDWHMITALWRPEYESKTPLWDLPLVLLSPSVSTEIETVSWRAQAHMFSVYIRTL
jgi:hypothetical protein